MDEDLEPKVDVLLAKKVKKHAMKSEIKYFLKKGSKKPAPKGFLKKDVVRKEVHAKFSSRRFSAPTRLPNSRANFQPRAQSQSHSQIAEMEEEK